MMQDYLFGFDIQVVMTELAKTRPVFHSEADFQFAFAWKLKEQFPKSEVRLEYPVPHLGTRRNNRLDVLIWLNGQMIPIEMKYITSTYKYIEKNEVFSLKSHDAPDQALYDIINDIKRIEYIVDKFNCPIGYTLSLTNYNACWAPVSTRMTIDADFRLPEGRLLTGDLGWADYAGVNSIKGRERRLVLNQEYTIHWIDYSKPSKEKNGVFRYLFTVCQGKDKI